MLSSILVPETCSGEENTEIVWMWGWSLVLILCLNCCVIASVLLLWLKFAQGLDKPVEVIGAVFILLAQAGYLSASKKKPFLGWRGASSTKGAAQMWSWWICASLHHCQSWSTEWQMCHSSAKLFCTSPRLCSLITLNELVHVFVDRFGDAHAFWQIVNEIERFSADCGSSVLLKSTTAFSIQSLSCW